MNIYATRGVGVLGVLIGSILGSAVAATDDVSKSFGAGPRGAPPEPQWRSRIEQSQMDDSRNVYLQVDANELLIARYGDSRPPVLVARCKENTLDAYIILRATPKQSGIERVNDRATVRVRYDDSPAEELTFIVSADRESIFFQKPLDQLQRMLNHDKLLVEVTPAGSGSQVISFDLTGLPDVIDPLRDACNWPS